MGWAEELGEGEEKMMEDGVRNGGYARPFGRWGHGSKAVFGGVMERGTGERLWSL